MFKDPKDEETVCRVLKALVEEYGPDMVTVHVPKKWGEHSDYSLGRCKLLCDTDKSIKIAVTGGCQYEMELAYV